MIFLTGEQGATVIKREEYPLKTTRAQHNSLLTKFPPLHLISGYHLFFFSNWPFNNMWLLV
jgi:hypothetical protein